MIDISLVSNKPPKQLVLAPVAALHGIPCHAMHIPTGTQLPAIPRYTIVGPPAGTVCVLDKGLRTAVELKPCPSPPAKITQCFA
jgi:hypothetical protein